MKKLLFVVFAISLFAGCVGNPSHTKEIQALNDSLIQVLNQKDNELNDIMSTMSDIQDGFQQINDAEGRVNLEKDNLEHSSKQDLLDNLEFIQNTLKLNRDLVTKLKQKLRNSTYNVSKLKKVVENLTRQINEKQTKIIELQTELESKDIQLAEKTQEIGNLSKDVNYLQADAKGKAMMIASQIQELNTAWYVFGTKSELKEENILKDGEVLKSDNFNKDYFTRIDIRVDKLIKLYSNSAKLLTNHPNESYTLEKDSENEYVLKITDYKKFWSISKYLVLQVK